MMLLTNWAAVWEIAGMGVGVVFAILVLLVFVLQIFSAIAGKASAPAAEAKAEPTVINPENEDYAAVAVAIWLHYNSRHDQDSGKLTITNDSERWHEVLNPTL